VEEVPALIALVAVAEPAWSLQVDDFVAGAFAPAHVEQAEAPDEEQVETALVPDDSAAVPGDDLLAAPQDDSAPLLAVDSLAAVQADSVPRLAVDSLAVGQADSVPRPAVDSLAVVQADSAPRLAAGSLVVAPAGPRSAGSRADWVVRVVQHFAECSDWDGRL